MAYDPLPFYLHQFQQCRIATVYTLDGNSVPS
jgi:hypothetical protein